MSDPATQAARALVEEAAAAVPGVRALYPTTLRPGAALVQLDRVRGTPRCRLRVATDLARPAAVVALEVAAAVRGALGAEDALVHVEIASID